MNNPGHPTGPFGRLRESEDEYRNNPAVSNSSLNTFIWNEYEYQQQFVLRNVQREDSPAFAFGRAFHCAILEPGEFESRFVMFDGDRRSKSYKDMVANEKRTILTRDEYDLIDQISDAVDFNTTACGLIDACETEVVFRHMCNGNLARQCRVDGITPFGDIIDLKSCQSIEEFRANFKRYGYHRQARWYERLVGAVTGDCNGEFTFIAVEKKRPFRCELFRLDPESARYADMEIDEAMVRLERCLETNTWRRNADEVQYIRIYQKQDAVA